jgi:hypothetical protein
MYTLILSSCPNPDFRQTSPPAPKQFFKVNSPEDAALIAIAYRDTHNLGSGNWSGGQVLDEDGNEVFQISYNGRIWLPNGEEYKPCA